MTIYDYLEKAALNWPKATFLSDENTRITFSDALQLVYSVLAMRSSKSISGSPDMSSSSSFSLKILMSSGGTRS